MKRVYLYSDGQLSRLSQVPLSTAKSKLHTVWHTATPTLTLEQIHRILRRSHLAAGLYAMPADEVKAAVESGIKGLWVNEPFNWPMFFLKLFLLPFAVLGIVYAGVVVGFFASAIVITTILSLAALVRKG